MEISHPHNLNRPYTEPRRYGIRVTLPPGDTFESVLGGDWERVHWYFTVEERDRAMDDMRRRHEYSRRGDYPRLKLEKLDSSDPA